MADIDAQGPLPHAAPRRSWARRVLDELGLVSLYNAPADVKLLCAQRFVRLFAYGNVTLVLVTFLRALEISPTRIGLFMTLTLAGDVGISFVLTLFADGIGRRAVLGLGAALMVVSGVAFALSSDYWVLLAAAVLGVISPAGNEVGPFRAVEESCVAHLTTSATRSDVYAWYSLLGTAGAAFGMMSCGWAVQTLSVQPGWDLLAAYRAVFYSYAVIGTIKLLLVLCLSRRIETESKQKPITQAARADATTKSVSESTPLLAENNGSSSGTANGNGAASAAAATDAQPKQRRGIFALLPEISKESQLVMLNLCVLFALDSFGSGLAPLSWQTFFFRSRYDIKEGELGTLFFVTSIIAAASMIVASSLAKRFGNVNTMVFTHIPSAIFLALIPVWNEVHLSLAFLILRSCTQSMDVAPRSAFLAAIILPGERTAVMGLVNVVKTMAQTLGPTITGVLADKKLFWVAFVSAGTLKVCYDLGLLVLFKNHEREKAERERIAAERREADEENAA